MRVFDASSIVWAWDQYPESLFPPLWKLMEIEIHAGEIVIPEVAMREIGHVSPDCHAWLTTAGLTPAPITNEALSAARQIKAQLGIVDDNYHSNGVDENDILVIAVARTFAAELVSEEAVQRSLPVNKARYRIPAACGLPSARVKCIRFVDYLKSFGRPIQ